MVDQNSASWNQLFRRLKDLFKLQTAYTYSGGINRRAVAALIIAVLPVVPGFLRAAVTPGGQVANPRFLDSLYTYAWFVTFGLSFALYLVLARRGDPTIRSRRLTPLHPLPRRRSCVCSTAQCLRCKL